MPRDACESHPTTRITRQVSDHILSLLKRHQQRKHDSHNARHRRPAFDQPSLERAAIVVYDDLDLAFGNGNGFAALLFPFSALVAIDAHLVTVIVGLLS